MVKSSILTVNPELYNRIRHCDNIVCDRYDHGFRSVGRNSCEIELTLSEKSTGTVFVKMVERALLFDVKAKKITQLEKLKNELILRNIKLTASSIDIKPTPSAPPTFTATRVVVADQVDYNKHLAAPWYIVMTVDVIQEANSQNFFKQPAYNFISTGLRVIQMEWVHQGEAVLGDELLFTVWWERDVIKIQATKNTTTNVAYLVIGLDKNTQSPHL